MIFLMKINFITNFQFIWKSKVNLSLKFMSVKVCVFLNIKIFLMQGGFIFFVIQSQCICMIIEIKLELGSWFGLVWFYDTSTVVGYLMPNPFLYI